MRRLALVLSHRFAPWLHLDLDVHACTHPPAGWTKIEVDEAAGDITVAIHMFNKSTTRIPEAMFVQVLPSAGKYAYI